MVANNRKIGSVLLSLVLLSTTSCGLLTSANSDAVSAATNVRTNARIPDETLADHGLEEVWYVPPRSESDRDGPVHSVYLLDEGLFVVTRPRPDGGEWLLKMISRENGHSVWAETLDGPIREAPYAYHYPAGAEREPELFFSIYDTIYCYDLRYGSLLWSKTVDPPVSSRVIANDELFFFGSDNNRFFAYRKESGGGPDAWTYLTGGRVAAAPIFNQNRSRIMFGSYDGTIYGMRPDSGYVPLQSWKTSTGARIVADLATYSRWVFAGSTDYKLYCLESNDGSVYWSFVAEAPIRDAPVVFRYKPNQEYVYCIGSEGPISAAERTLFAVPLSTSRGGGGVAAWRAKGVRKVVTIGKETLYVVNDSGGAGERTLSGLGVEDGDETFRLPVTGYDLVPTNHADAGRNASERGRIFLISRTGEIQCIAEKS